MRYSDAKARVQQRVDRMKGVPKIVLQDRVQRWYAEQSAEFPASQDIKEPVLYRWPVWSG